VAIAPQPAINKTNHLLWKLVRMTYKEYLIMAAQSPQNVIIKEVPISERDFEKLSSKELDNMQRFFNICMSLQNDN
jgi:hypothetical protein